jgi:hypothetical protein
MCTCLPPDISNRIKDIEEHKKALIIGILQMAKSLDIILTEKEINDINKSNRKSAQFTPISFTKTYYNFVINLDTYSIFIRTNKTLN